MSDKKINLEEILDSHLSLCSVVPPQKHFYIVAMKEAIKQALEIASENAEGDIVDDTNYSNGRVVIDKQSIINTINQIN